MYIDILFFLIIDKISLLKRHFPYSLTSSVLLANLSWEFVMFWNRDITKLEALEAALSVLRQIPMKRIRHGELMKIIQSLSVYNFYKKFLSCYFRCMLPSLVCSFKKENGKYRETH